MSRESCSFRRSQELADPQHDVAGIRATRRPAPLRKLRGEVARRLAGKRRVARPRPLAVHPVARRARRQRARRIAACVEIRRMSATLGRLARGQRHRGIVDRNRAPLGLSELLGDVAHLRMGTASVRIGDQLALEVADIERGKPGREGPVAAAVEPVAREAGVRGARRTSTERNQLACRGEAIGRIRRRGDASPEGRSREQGTGDHSDHSAWGTGSLPRRFQPVHRFGRHPGTRLPHAARALLLLPLLVVACKPPPEARTEMALADAARGRLAAERAGCASCHTIPGIGWPQGKTAPTLAGLDRRALIAGRLPNRPEVLAAFVRDAPTLVPGTAMPAMPLTEREALDVAAFLYAIGG